MTPIYGCLSQWPQQSERRGWKLRVAMGGIHYAMNAPLGYALLRDRRVSLRPKLVALGVGLAVLGFVELLQIPLESLLALVLPGVGAAGDIAIDGAEAVIVPVLVATLLMPYLAPPSIVRELRAQHAARV
jgi:hypothetical protein